MEPDQAERDARVVRTLDELDDIEAKIEELHSVARPRTIAIYLLLLLVPVAALLAVLALPGVRSFAPFLIVGCAYALIGLRWIGRKNEELAELKEERARLAGEPTA